uniref:Eh domain-containing protein 1-like n=1 Tax=Tetraselmis sp. GSL018 TaxID=582737 RepID=A0A061S3M1_9CHLO
MSVRDALKKVYFAKVRPLEQDYGFGNFHSPCLTAGDFNAKPSVLLIGQYSTGKTTFIRHLLKRDYPGILIGPEPTTDRFVVVSHGEQDVRTPGNTVVITGTKPYQALATYGEGFLSRFEEVQLNHELLQGLSLIDTPGVLAGEKQRLHRAYNFIDVCAWFASRCDMILLLFDPFKLDISDEFRQVIDAMKDHHDKIRVVLNKADQVSSQELMRVYGALMWSLAKVLRSPEVSKVYTGSFADDRVKEKREETAKDGNPLGTNFFEEEQQDLLRDLEAIPMQSRDRKISEFTKRVRAAKTHLIVAHNLRKKLPWFGKEAAERRLLDNLDIEFTKMKNDFSLRTFELAPGDFPSAEEFRSVCLAGSHIRSFPLLSESEFRKKIAMLDDVLQRELPNISRMEEL